MKYLLYILAVLLALRGLRLILGMSMNWISFNLSVKPYDKRVNGKVVDVKDQENINSDLAPVRVPIVEYKLEGEDEVQHTLICNKLVWCGDLPIRISANFSVGDQVTVRYNSENREELFVQPKWQRVGMIWHGFIPGLFFLTSSVLGMIYAIYNL